MSAGLPTSLDVHLTTPGFFLQPDYFDVLATMRRLGPVHRTADGLLALVRYEDVRTVSRDPGRFVSGRGVLINDPLRDVDGRGRNTWSILHLDPPLHATYRTLVNRQFTPRAVAGLEQRIRAIVREVLDGVPVGEPFDLVERVAAPIPIAVVAELFGVAETDRSCFRQWSDAVIESPDRTDGERAAELAEMAAYLAALADSPAAESNALLRLLKTVTLENRPLNRDEILGFCVTLLVAGNETTRTLLAGGVETLALHPDQRTLLARDPSLLSGAVEELLRWVTPIQAFGRTAAVDCELAGVPITAGEFVVMLYASANRDEAVFGPTADRLDVSRPSLPVHLAFGFGEHVCLGASLARLEARIFFDELLARHREFDLGGPAVYTPSTLVRAPRELPIVLGS